MYVRTKAQISTGMMVPLPTAHTSHAQVDVYSFSMILYQLFEHTPPFAGVDPVEAARQAALYDKRPNLMQLGEQKPFPMGVRAIIVFQYLIACHDAVTRACLWVHPVDVNATRTMLLYGLTGLSPPSRRLDALHCLFGCSSAPQCRLLIWCAVSNA